MRTCSGIEHNLVDVVQEILRSEVPLFKSTCILSISMSRKKMDGHSGRVKALGISGEMQLIASSDDKGELIAWDRDR
jgi:hypothetical protein